jgi:hypothetical protein
VRETDDLIDRVATSLRREQMMLATDFDERVMRAVRVASREVGRRGLWRWMLQPRSVSVSPLGALALAAGLAGVVALAARQGDPAATAVVEPPPVAVAPVAAQQMTRFVFNAESASRVTIVGDFNDWDPDASPLQEMGKGVWTITIPLAPGRYQYTFVVDGTSWVADPGAPRTLEDDFGQPNSIITVGDATT